MNKFPLRRVFFIGILFCFRLTFAIDPHSFSNPDEVAVKHISFDLEVDFPNQKILGKAVLSLINKTGATKLVLDTRDLVISSVRVGRNKSNLRKVESYSLGSPDKLLGQALSIQLAVDDQIVEVTYSTNSDAKGLSWTKAEPAKGVRDTFYTVSETIWARSWFPCQDSPSVRFTYDAKIRVPKHLLPLMSATNPQKKNRSGIYPFKMDLPIPSYLVALAVGDFEFQATGPRTGIYAPPEYSAQAYKDFRRLEDLLKSGEAIFGPYDWQRYDVLVLPKSWPYGAMENPRLTFVGLSYLGDELGALSVIAHELAHSWTGNKVSNANWQNFSLNEGPTVWAEDLIVERLLGVEVADLNRELKYKNLFSLLEQMENSMFKTLMPQMPSDISPDANISKVPYDKGMLLLKTIEATIGRPAMLKFMQTYIQRYAFQSVTWYDFLDVLKELHPSISNQIDFNHWLMGTDIPSRHFAPYSPELHSIQKKLELWLANKQSIDDIDLSNPFYLKAALGFLLNLAPGSVNPAKMQELNDLLNMSKHPAGLLRLTWYSLVIKNRFKMSYTDVFEEAKAWPNRLFSFASSFIRFLPDGEGTRVAQDLTDQVRPYANALAVLRTESFIAARIESSKSMCAGLFSGTK